MAEQIKIFDFSFGGTVENLAKLRAELKETKKAFEQADPKSAGFKELGTTVKVLETQVKTLTSVTKDSQNALGGINTTAKFAAGSYGELKQKIDANRKSLLELTVGSDEFNAVQNELIKLQEQRINVESKIPSLFQERIKGAIDESNALKQLRIDLKNAQAAALNGDGAAAQRVAELKDKIDDLKDSTQSLQGTGVERLNTSMNLLTEGFKNFDADKVKTGFKGIGAAMSAIPIVLIIEGIKALIDNFDEVVKFAKMVTGSFSAAEKQVKDLTIATERETVANKGLINAYTNEIALLTAKGGHEKEIIELKKKKIAIEIKEAENTVRLNAAKVAEAVLNNSITDSVNNLTIALLRKVGATETADKLDEIQSKVRKVRILEEQKDQIKAIEDAKLAIATSKNELLVIDAEYNKKLQDNAKETAKKNKETLDKQLKDSLDAYNKEIEQRDEMAKSAAATEDAIQKAAADIQLKRLAEIQNAKEQALNDDIARANTAYIEAVLNAENTYNEELAILKANQAKELNETELTEAQKAEIKARYRLAERDLEQQKLVDDLSTAQTYTESVGTLSNALFEVKRSNLEKGSEEDKAAAKQQFEANKAFSIATAIISGAVAVINASATVPYVPVGLATSIAAAATTAATISKISTTEFQYFDGGYTGKGNPRDVSTNLGKRPYTYHTDEYIVPSKVLNSPEGSHHVSRLEAMRQNVSKTNITGFYDGGFTGRQAANNAVTSGETINGIVDAIRKQPAPIVRVTDINKINQSRATGVNVSNL